MKPIYFLYEWNEMEASKRMHAAIRNKTEITNSKIMMAHVDTLMKWSTVKIAIFQTIVRKVSKHWQRHGDYIRI